MRVPLAKSRTEDIISNVLRRFQVIIVMFKRVCEGIVRNYQAKEPMMDCIINFYPPF